MNMAHVIAERSLCDRDKVGAVIVSRTNRIIDTGYNGPPAGFCVEPSVMTGSAGCQSWCERGRKITTVTKVFNDNTVVGVLTGTTLAGDYSDCPALHAEANALMFSDRRLREGGTIYVSSAVCGSCAKLIANSGLSRVVCDITHSPEHRNSGKWFEFLQQCGLIVDEMRH